MALRVLVPSPALAHAISGPGIEAIIWHIDSEASPAPAADVLITERPRVQAHRSRVNSIPGLRHVHLLSIGYEWVLDHLPPGATLSNSRGAVEDATAEHGLALTLAALRDLPVAATQQHRHDWTPLWTTSLHGSVVVLLGHGGVGREVAARLAPFRPAAVLPVARRERTTESGVHVHGVQELPGLLPRADVVIVTLPHAAGTERLVDGAFLAAMADGALLVNIGRGAVVDTEALVAELQSGRLRAALDVVDPEPLPAGHRLWEAPGCLLTPHMAGNTNEFIRLSTEGAVEQVQRLAQGRAPIHLVAGPGAG
ncbi:MAG: NAD(P)-dependent oxidoreductase [Arthrobacter sp.]|uniref:NAD(P)-dependent oxidoreductase n=1 Tax=unclassified Arthrobacter TaxID=235627 RepID=UPI002651A4AA|nr:hydroxyacid dehydrogenase [Micrococcaceae bacterium]MDN5812256.1 hydroxyacid dehydrogenase [Micrococcaceae bacterium]MDN5822699.1 hydroxyacid dehydrogenase [Micrococcaceae bacterium]MDN5878163.1 hydroxyacid dehydrogenase [Micrococcaceae bacterium]MDN5886557.1 hydroxyacid dehydrogenase [Micrococcaceae bacterium]